MDKNPPANEGDRGSILDLERSKARAPQAKPVQREAEHSN